MRTFSPQGLWNGGLWGTGGDCIWEPLGIRCLWLAITYRAGRQCGGFMRQNIALFHENIFPRGFWERGSVGDSGRLWVRKP
jgi:hypothetical protein